MNKGKFFFALSFFSYCIHFSFGADASSKNNNLDVNYNNIQNIYNQAIKHNPLANKKNNEALKKQINLSKQWNESIEKAYKNRLPQVNQYEMVWKGNHVEIVKSPKFQEMLENFKQYATPQNYYKILNSMGIYDTKGILDLQHLISVEKALKTPHFKYYLFISSSIPFPVLRSYVKQIAANPDTVMLLRGCIGGCHHIGPTAKYIRKLLVYKKIGNQIYSYPVEIWINPVIFEDYGITRVPCLAKAQDTDKLLPDRSIKTPAVCGDWKLSYLKKELNKLLTK
ncbi:MAG: hypothetical protein C0172_01985 [Caldisphaera sp.]|nr:MAG: hypothetical protein C0172_01985 [Caldisphaera sp.]